MGESTGISVTNLRGSEVPELKDLLSSSASAEFPQEAQVYSSDNPASEINVSNNLWNYIVTEGSANVNLRAGHPAVTQNVLTLDNSSITSDANTRVHGQATDNSRLNLGARNDLIFASDNAYVDAGSGNNHLSLFGESYGVSGDGQDHLTVSGKAKGHSGGGNDQGSVHGSGTLHQQDGDDTGLIASGYTDGAVLYQGSGNDTANIVMRLGHKENTHNQAFGGSGEDNARIFYDKNGEFTSLKNSDGSTTVSLTRANGGTDSFILNGYERITPIAIDGERNLREALSQLNNSNIRFTEDGTPLGAPEGAPPAARAEAPANAKEQGGASPAP